MTGKLNKNHRDATKTQPVIKKNKNNNNPVHFQNWRAAHTHSEEPELVYPL